jgi:hypothetical protein
MQYTNDAQPREAWLTPMRLPQSRRMHKNGCHPAGRYLARERWTEAGPRKRITSYVREIGSEILTAGGGSCIMLGGSKRRGTNPNGAADK